MTANPMRATPLLKEAEPADLSVTPSKAGGAQVELRDLHRRFGATLALRRPGLQPANQPPGLERVGDGPKADSS